MNRSIFFLLCFVTLFAQEELLYHGSLTDGIERLEPRLRYTPGEECNSQAGIYASDLRAFAAAHSFPWSSADGIDLYVDGIGVTLEVPHALCDRLQTESFIYVINSQQFSLLDCEATGHTFRALEPVDCLEKIAFPSVLEAIEHYGGRVVIKTEE